jgi:hypothetical protein
MDVGPMVGTLAHIFDYLNPSRSPYLLAALVGAVVLFLFSDRATADSYVGEMMFLVPVLIAFAFFVALSLVYHDRLLDSLSDKEEMARELDAQFKFARATGLAAAFVMLFLL